MDFKSKTKIEKIKIIVVLICVFITVFFAVTAEIFFPGTGFANVIANSIGKFFNILKFFELHAVRLLESATIIFFVWLIGKAISLLIALLIRKGQRSETVGQLLTSIVKYTSVLIAIFLILSAWGVETPTLLVGAGILGLALSFGAQSLIEDVISGLFIIFEKQFAIGDVVQINEFRGAVIEIGIRTTKFEDISGDIKILNNADIRGAINTSSHLSPAICDISISYDEDIERVEKIINANLEKIKTAIPDIVDGPYYRGVQSLADSSVIIRMLARTNEAKRYQVARDLNREMKVLFDKNNVKIPYPQIVVHYEDKELNKTKG